MSNRAPNRASNPVFRLGWPVFGFVFREQSFFRNFTWGGNMQHTDSMGVNHSRRSFLSQAAQWSTLLAAYPLLPLPVLVESLAGGSRVAQAPIVDKGFASVRKVGDGLYATISDTSK